MAAQKTTPQPSPGYFGMLALTALSMLIGIVCLALEANEYDWDPKPKATEKIALPSAAPKGNVLAPGLPRDTVEAKAEPVKPAPDAVAEKPLPAPVFPDLKRSELPTVAAKPVEPKATPVVPVPSPLTLPVPKATTPTATQKEPATNDEPAKPAPSPLRFGQPKG